MASRLYFQLYALNGVDPAMPAAYSWWNATASTAKTGKLVRTPSGLTPPVEIRGSKSVATSPYNVLYGRFMSDPLAGGTINSGSSFRFVLPTASVDATNGINSFPSVVVRLFNSAMVQKAVLYSGGPSNTSATTSGATANNRQAPSTLAVTRRFSATLTGGATVDPGDRLVVEMGVRFVTASTSNNSVDLAFGSREDAIADMPFAHDVNMEPFSPTYRNFRTWIEFDDNFLSPLLAVGESKFGDNGWVLNRGSSLPFVDIDSYDGVDAAPVQSSTANRQGGHGGYVNSQWEAPRTVTVAGTLYTSPATTETDLQRLKKDFAPSFGDKPFYLGTDMGTMIFFGKSQGLRYTMDRSRGYGVIKFQVQIVCQDSRRYLDNPQSLVIPAAGEFTILGDRDTPGKLKITTSTVPYTATGSPVEIINNLGTLSGLYQGPGGGNYLSGYEEMVLDLDSRQIFINGLTNVRDKWIISSWAPLSAGTNYIGKANDPSYTYRLEYLPAYW